MGQSVSAGIDEEDGSIVRCDAFREAAERGDVAATMATMSPGVVLRSPVRDEPLSGREAVTRLFAVLLPAFDDLRFIESYTSVRGGELLHFVWRIGNQEAEGVDVMHFNGDGLIEDYRVMLRPLSAVTALRDVVFSRLPPGP
ncbi:MAG TPA: nuclear transport factor 2 family protein [Acidimicrobiales bacterium]|nr:nuclear transport factor 2 family protein [Acidimicrobiales bacterium]